MRAERELADLALEAGEASRDRVRGRRRTRSGIRPWIGTRCRQRSAASIEVAPAQSAEHCGPVGRSVSGSFAPRSLAQQRTVGEARARGQRPGLHERHEPIGKPGIVHAMQMPPTFGQPPTPAVQPRIGTLHLTTGPLQPILTRQPRGSARVLGELALLGKARPLTGSPGRCGRTARSRRPWSSSSGISWTPARWSARCISVSPRDVVRAAPGSPGG